MAGMPTPGPLVKFVGPSIMSQMCRDEPVHSDLPPEPLVADPAMLHDMQVKMGLAQARDEHPGASADGMPKSSGGAASATVRVKREQSTTFFRNLKPKVRGIEGCIDLTADDVEAAMQPAEPRPPAAKMMDLDPDDDEDVFGHGQESL